MLGKKVRRLRREQGLTQVQMADRLGISPSYLNLIEHNQRPLTLPVLLKLSRIFEVDLQAFSEDDDGRLFADLSEIFGDPLFTHLDLARAELNEVVAASPPVAHAISLLYRNYRRARDDLETLAERLSDDPLLTTAGHELRTLLTSVRSFAEILHDNAQLGSGQRQQFLGILVTESERLTEQVERVLDIASGAALGRLGDAKSPADEVDEMIQQHANHFPELEQAASALRQAVDGKPDGLEAGLARQLSERHGTALEITAPEPVAERFDEADRRLLLSEMLPPAERRFRLARRIGLFSCEPIFQRYIGKARLSDAETTRLCRRALAGYYAGAVLMPYDPFLEAARSLRYDIDRLSGHFGTSFVQTCYRLATLQRAGAKGVPFHFLRIDIAGNVSKRYAGSGLRIPRHGGVCPRWNVHAAFLSPGQIDRQIARMPDGGTFFCLARAITEGLGGHLQPKTHFAVAIGCDISYAREIVYADGIDLDNDEAVVPVGSSCRICDRSDCAQRAFAPLAGDLAPDEPAGQPGDPAADTAA